MLARVHDERLKLRGRFFIAATIGATFMKLGRAPTTLMTLIIISSNAVGTSQYRNAVASGPFRFTRSRGKADPTLPRFGTDCFPRN